MRRRNPPNILKILSPNTPPSQHLLLTLMQHRRGPRIITRQHHHRRRLFTVLAIVNLPMHRALRKQRARVLRQVANDLGARAVGQEAALEGRAGRDGVVGQGDEEFGGARVDVREEDAAGADGAEVDVQPGVEEEGEV
jgi:hypothetical protein